MSAIRLNGKRPGVNGSAVKSAPPKTVAEVTPARVQLEIQARFSPIRGLTPALLSSHLDNFQSGWIAWAALVWEAIERRDDVLKGIAAKRKKDVARLDYEIIVIDDSPEAAAHKAALEDFYNHISVINALDENERGGFQLLVRQMMDAVGKKYAVHEIVLQPGERLTAEFRFAPLWFFENRSGRLRYVPIFGGMEGTELEDGGWMITTGDGLMEASSVAYMFKQMPLKDWVAFSEKFGMPGVVGRTSAAQGTPQGDAMVEAVRNFGTDWSCVLFGDEGSGKIELVEAKGGSSNLPFAPLVERMDRAMSALWRGSDLSTMSADNKGASVQGDEGDILLLDDASMISETLNTQVGRWVIAQRFGTDEPMAFLKIVVPERQNVDLDLKIDELLLKAGAKLGERERLEHYGRPVIDPADTPLQNPATVTERVSENVDGKGKPVLPKVQPLANEAAASLLQNAMAEALGVTPRWLAPVADLFAQMEKRAGDATLTDADLLKFLQDAGDRIPELLGDMDIHALADVFEGSEGAAALQGMTTALRKHRTNPTS